MAAINADLQGRAALCGPVMRLGVRQEADSRETRDAAALGAAASCGRDEDVKERIKEHKSRGTSVEAIGRRDGGNRLAPRTGRTGACAGAWRRAGGSGHG